MIRRIIVNIRTVYGKDLIYPIDDNAQRFANIKGTKTLTMADLILIESLGFEIEYTKKTDIALL